MHVCVLSEETVKTCSTQQHKFCQATMTAITWLKHNWCNVLVGVMLGITLPVVSVVLLCAAFTCFTYECYSYIKDIPVMICTIGMPVVFGIIFFIYHTYMANTGQLDKQYRNTISIVIDPVFSSFLKKPNSIEEEEKFIVLGYEVSFKEMRWLYPVLVQVILLAMAQFWDDFLLEVSRSCSTDSNQDCFYTPASNTTNSTLPYQELNCMNTSQVEEAISIVCYKYVFHTGRAAASAIGIISAASLTTYAVCIVFLKVLDGVRLSNQFIALVKGVAILEVILFCVVVGVLQAYFTSSTTGVLGTLTSFQKTVGIGSLIANSVFLLPVGKFRKLENRDEHIPLSIEPQHETV